ncbi:MAG: LON peptidase substrate-binding domain-containing protein [Candidatus Sericytochromatia bacterium]|nr:LON peptidase substrate-binding domain-containing protein [Candidatus Sericytochromatia bacterium]
MEPRLLPLFPLNVVLFPGMVLPLRIFEPRYRLMVRRCLAADKQFGVVLIEDGEEVGAPATPRQVGTVAEISGHEILPDGQIMIVSVGVRRFRLLERVEGEPYQQGRVELIEEGDPAAPVDARLVSEATEALESYLKGLAAVSNLAVSLPDEALSPIDLSYLMAASLQVDNGRKQALLEVVPVDERLVRVLAAVRDENDRIARFLAKGRSRGDFFYRGHRLSVN